MTKTNQNLPTIEKISGGQKFVIIHIGDLVDSFINGTHKFFNLIENNKKLSEKVILKADNYYAPLDQYLI